MLRAKARGLPRGFASLGPQLRKGLPRSLTSPGQQRLAGLSPAPTAGHAALLLRHALREPVPGSHSARVAWEPFAQQPRLILVQQAHQVQPHTLIADALRAPLLLAHGGALSAPGASPAIGFGMPAETAVPVGMELSSTKKKRKLKMNQHKVSKRRKKDRYKNKV
mmetsp:Transcript_40537/g.100216  ORF Transcript_40537/g.100216 Transcript_40537/m.100216 type:complete len:165 (-) Transcript_40537:400-894(-)